MSSIEITDITQNVRAFLGESPQKSDAQVPGIDAIYQAQIDGNNIKKIFADPVGMLRAAGIIVKDASMVSVQCVNWGGGTSTTLSEACNVHVQITRRNGRWVIIIVITC